MQHIDCDGLSLVTHSNDHFQSVSIGVLVRVGLAQESVGGEAHFLEHMCFKGTPNYTAKAIVELVDNMGGYINAMTDREYTLYYITVPADCAETALGLISDLVLNSNLNQSDIDKERHVVLEEINMINDSPEDLVYELWYSDCWANSSFSNSILGTPNSLAQINSDNLRDFRNYYWQRSQMIVSITGASASVNALLDMIPIYFPTPPTNTPILDSLTPDINPVCTTIHKQTEQTHFCLGLQGCAYTDPNQYAFSMISTILGGTMSSRLFQEIREKRGWAYSIYSACSFYEATGSLIIAGGVSNDQYTPTLSVIRSLFSDLKTTGIDSNELTKVKRYIKGSFAINLETSTSWMMFLAKSWFYYRELRPVTTILDKIDAVSLTDIQQITASIDLAQAGLTAIGPVDTHKKTPIESVWASIAH